MDLVPDAIELLFESNVTERRKIVFERRDMKRIKDSLIGELNILQTRPM